MGDTTGYIVASIQKAISQLDASFRPADLEDRYTKSHEGWKRDESCGQSDMEDHSYWFQCGFPTGNELSYRFGWNGMSKIEDEDAGWGLWMSSEQVTKNLTEEQIARVKQKPKFGQSKYWTTRSNRYKEIDELLPPHVQSKAKQW